MIWIIHWNLEKVCLANFFFHFFQHWFFLVFMYFFNFFFMYFITSKIIFSKFGMYLTYKNRFWVHFSWFLGRDINSTVWTRNGSKIKKRVMVFKGLNVTLLFGTLKQHARSNNIIVTNGISWKLLRFGAKRHLRIWSLKFKKSLNLF